MTSDEEVERRREKQRRYKTLADACKANRACTSHIRVYINGELWEINPQQGSGMLLDSSERNRGERCNTCGTRRTPNGIARGNNWFCGNFCLQTERDRFAEPKRDNDNQGEEE